MKKIWMFLSVLCFLYNAQAQDKMPAYVLYNAQGKKVSFKKLIKAMEGSDIVLFGEQHNNPIAHWLQLESIKALHPKRNLVLGAEMIEADNQAALDAYLNGNVDNKGLDTLARLWGNYKTDYAPLVDFCKNNNLAFIATNVPRTYARMVHKGGFEALENLDATALQWLVPLPFPFDPNLPTYKSILEMMGDHGSIELVKAQALKDATMAHFILKNREDSSLFVHFNGAYHSDNYEGILWYLKNAWSDLQYLTVSTVTQENVFKLEKEHLRKADFIICVDKDMTTTY